MKTSVEKLPINLALYKRAQEWVRGFAQISKNRVTKKAVDEIYEQFTQQAQSEAEIQEIVRYQEWMGWLPKGSHTGKFKKYLRLDGTPK